ncbi:MAG TPA: hypothetical protein VF701_15690, partial [Thermoanaerobaculia bacterium]
RCDARAWHRPSPRSLATLGMTGFVATSTLKTWTRPKRGCAFERLRLQLTPLRLSLALTMLLLAAIAVPLQGAEILVLLPLGNVSGDDAAPEQVRELLVKRVSARGWSIAPEGEVESILEAERVRYLDSLPASAREKLASQFGAAAILTGTILAWADGPDPVVALALRMTDADGRVVWGEIVAASASEMEGLMGAGRAKTAAALAPRVIARLTRQLPEPGAAARVAPGRGTSILRRDPPTFRSALHAQEELRRICVLPFDSTTRNAARIIGEILTIRLASTGEFEVIEAADFRGAMRAERFQSLIYMTSEELARLEPHLGTTLFLRGNVHTFRQGRSGTTEIQLDMNLADVASGEILWATTHQRRGIEYSGLFERGTIQSVITLADRVVSEVVIAQANARPQGPTSNRSRSRLARGRQ